MNEPMQPVAAPPAPPTSVDDPALAAASIFFGVDTSKQKPDPIPPPTVAERLLSLDNSTGMWANALTEPEWSLWKLVHVFGFTPEHCFDAIRAHENGETLTEDFDFPNDAMTNFGMAFFDWYCARIIQPGVVPEQVKFFDLGLLSVDDRSRGLAVGGYSIMLRRRFRRNSETKVYVRGINALLASAVVFATDALSTVESLREAAETATTKLRTLAEFKINLLNPEPTKEQLSTKRELQKIALDAPAMREVMMTVMEREVMSAWIDCEWSGRKTAAKLGGAHRTVANVISGFLNRCAEAQAVRKKNREPLSTALEAFIARVPEARERPDDPDYEVALALAGRSAFGDAHVQNHYHARSFDTWGRFHFVTAHDLEGVAGNRGHEGSSEAFWEVGNDDEYDGQ